jgi:hypothetical protein
MKPAGVKGLFEIFLGEPLLPRQKLARGYGGSPVSENETA